MLYSKIEEAVENVFSSNHDLKSQKKTNMNTHRNVKLLLCKKKKMSKKILKTKSVNKITILKNEIEIMEETLKSSYEEYRNEIETKVINQLSTDSGAFYRFARSKSVIKPMIGPLKDKNGNLITENKHMAQILVNQYSNICSIPRYDLESQDFNEFLHENDENMSGLHDIYIDREFLKKSIAKLSCQSGPGPDGVPPLCLKNGGNYILDALQDISQISLSESITPEIVRQI